MADAQLQNMKDYPAHSDRMRPRTTKTNAEMWNIKQTRADLTVAAGLAVQEIAALVDLGSNIPKATVSIRNYTQATKDVASVDYQATQMDVAIDLVNASGLKMSTENKNNVINYVFDGTLPPGGMMQNSGIIQAGNSILKANNKPIRPTDVQIRQMFSPRDLEIRNLVHQTTH